MHKACRHADLMLTSPYTVCAQTPLPPLPSMHLPRRWGLVAPLNTSFHVQPVPAVESQLSDGGKDSQSSAACPSDGQAWQARLPDHILELIFDKLLLPGSRQCPSFVEQVTGLPFRGMHHILAGWEGTLQLPFLYTAPPAAGWLAGTACRNGWP